MRLFQKDAYIGVDFLAKSAEIIKMKQEADANAFTFDIETPKGPRTIAITNPVVQDSNAIKAELQAFVHSIQNNTPTIVSEIDGYRAMEVAHKILQKINANLSVQ
jgi:hypothetical protein